MLWKSRSLWTLVLSSFFFFSVIAPPLQFPGKDVLSVHWKASYRERRNLTSCPHHSLSHLFPHHLLLLLPQHFCTFPILPIHVVCVLSLLNNNPSVCKCVWRYFWPLQGHRALSALLLFLSPSLFVSSAAIWL